MTQAERKHQPMTQAEGKHQTLHQHSIAASGDPTAKKAREERLPKQKPIRYQVLKGDVLDRLGDLLDESVLCVVTTPPYWEMRDYGGCTWDGGQIGLQATREEYLDNMVAIFREVRRVLRKDGTCWINMGDSYEGSGGSGPDDLSGMHWRVANALQATVGGCGTTSPGKSRTPCPRAIPTASSKTACSLWPRTRRTSTTRKPSRNPFQDRSTTGTKAAFGRSLGPCQQSSWSSRASWLARATRECCDEPRAEAAADNATTEGKTSRRKKSTTDDTAASRPLNNRRRARRSSVPAITASRSSVRVNSKRTSHTATQDNRRKRRTRNEASKRSARLRRAMGAGD
jgi:hypothetical protein